MVVDRQTGVVAKWLNHKGIGFITPNADVPEGEDKKDILVHFEQIKQNTADGFRSLKQGSSVEYDLKQDEKNPEKMVAVNVTGEGGEDCEPRAKGEGKGKRTKGKGKGKRSKGKGKRKGKGKSSDEDKEDEE